jgi:hypothetical protein
MNKLTSSILATFILVGCSNLYSQSCTGFHKKNCKSGTADGWIYNSQSKSGLFEDGMSSEIKIVIFKNFDYAFTLCCEKSLGRGDISLTMKDAKTGEMIYDNSTDDKQQHIEFTCQTTRSVIVTVTPGGSGGGGGTSTKSQTEDKKAGSKTSSGPKTADAVNGGCLGLLIEQKAASKEGF